MRIEKNKPVVLADGTTLDPTKKLGIFDASGQQLPYVFGFDTETCEIEMMLKLGEEKKTDDGVTLCELVRGEDMRPYVAKFILPGAYVMDEEGNVLK